jgi:isopentenyl-diphosphate delta-isomerase
MTDEILDIVDKKGRPTGTTALKSEAHSKGLYHNTIHLWLFTAKGDILLQQRSHKKTIYPLLWDVSVAGHIDAGESFIEATLRETEEEIGLLLQPESLVKIGVKLHESSYNEGTIQDNEFHQIYIAELKVGLNKLIPQETEVEALKLVSFQEFDTLLKHSTTNSHFIATNRSYYVFIIDALKKHLSL